MKLTCKCGAFIEGPDAPFYATNFLKAHEGCLRAEEHKVAVTDEDWAGLATSKINLIRFETLTEGRRTPEAQIYQIVLEVIKKAKLSEEKK